MILRYFETHEIYISTIVPDKRDFSVLSKINFMLTKKKTHSQDKKVLQVLWRTCHFRNVNDQQFIRRAISSSLSLGIVVLLTRKWKKHFGVINQEGNESWFIRVFWSRNAAWSAPKKHLTFEYPLIWSSLVEEVENTNTKYLAKSLIYYWQVLYCKQIYCVVTLFYPPNSIDLILRRKKSYAPMHWKTTEIKA